MQRYKIKGKLKYCCCWILLLQLINLSIDPARHANFINGKLTFQEDLSINKVESVYELLLEHIFKKDVPETQDVGNHSLAKMFIIFHQIPNPDTQIILKEEPIQHNHGYQALIPELAQALESPPPKA